MPSHQKPKTIKLRSCDTYTQVPILVFKVQSLISLKKIESMIFNHIILHSLNFHGNSYARSWTIISPTEFAKTRNVSRQFILESLTNLIKYGVIESREVMSQTSSGMQKSREFRLVSNEKLEEVYDFLSSTAQSVGDNHSLSPEKRVKSVGDNHSLSPRQAIVVTLTGHSCHLDRPWLSPWGVNLSKSLENIASKESLNNIKEFIIKLKEFQNSFLNLYSLEAQSKSALFKIKMETASLIRRYGLFSTYTAMLVNIFSEESQIGNFEVINAFLETNEMKLKEEEKNLKTHSDNLFNALLKLQDEIDTENLDVFYENFKASASALLIKRELEQSSSIFLYSSFHEDVLRSFKTCNFNLNRFTNETLDHVNLYFKSKILGVRGMNSADALESSGF